MSKPPPLLLSLTSNVPFMTTTVTVLYQCLFTTIIFLQPNIRHFESCMLAESEINADIPSAPSPPNNSSPADTMQHVPQPANLRFPDSAAKQQRIDAWNARSNESSLQPYTDSPSTPRDHIEDCDALAQLREELSCAMQKLRTLPRSTATSDKRSTLKRLLQELNEEIVLFQGSAANLTTPTVLSADCITPPLAVSKVTKYRWNRANYKDILTTFETDTTDPVLWLNDLDTILETFQAPMQARLQELLMLTTKCVRSWVFAAIIQQNKTWHEAKLLFIDRYRLHDVSKIARKALREIKQGHLTLIAFRDIFEKYVHESSGDMNDVGTMELFISRLRPAIRDHLNLHLEITDCDFHAVFAMAAKYDRIVKVTSILKERTRPTRSSAPKVPRTSDRKQAPHSAVSKSSCTYCHKPGLHTADNCLSRMADLREGRISPSNVDSPPDDSALHYKSPLHKRNPHGYPSGSCYSCGAVGHNRGDRSCPDFVPPHNAQPTQSRATHPKPVRGRFAMVPSPASPAESVPMPSPELPIEGHDGFGTSFPDIVASSDYVYDPYTGVRLRMMRRPKVSPVPFKHDEIRVPVSVHSLDNKHNARSSALLDSGCTVCVVSSLMASRLSLDITPAANDGRGTGLDLLVGGSTRTGSVNLVIRAGNKAVRVCADVLDLHDGTDLVIGLDAFAPLGFRVEGLPIAYPVDDSIPPKTSLPDSATMTNPKTWESKSDFNMLN